MSGRRDYYHDPAAPQATSLVPGGSALVTDEAGRVLMQRRADSGNWALPGGTMDIGETLGECIIREVKEETGLDIAITGLLGIYTDPQHVIAYTDGEIRQEFNITYLGRVVGGSLAVSDESTEVRFIDPAEFDGSSSTTPSASAYATTQNTATPPTSDSQPGLASSPSRAPLSAQVAVTVAVNTPACLPRRTTPDKKDQVNAMTT